nr:nitroreductase family protein [Bradyrhizobium sp. 151]
MSALDAAVLGAEEKCSPARSPTDELLTGRFACREFSDAPVRRSIIEEILRGAVRTKWCEHPALARLCADRRHKRQRVGSFGGSARNVAGRARIRIQVLRQRLARADLKRRREFGRLFYDSLGIARADSEARSRQTAKNHTFFGAPVRFIVTIDRRLEVGSSLDLGRFVRNVMLAAAGRGLQSCPQETFSKYHRILRNMLAIPAEQIVVCGISIGKANVESQERLMPRADVDEFATFLGFES